MQDTRNSYLEAERRSFFFWAFLRVWLGQEGVRGFEKYMLMLLFGSFCACVFVACFYRAVFVFQL